MIALESGTHGDGYICFLLLVGAKVDVEGVDLHHISDVSIFFASIILLPTLPTLSSTSLHYLVLDRLNSTDGSTFLYELDIFS